MDNGTTLVNGHRDTGGMTPAVRPLVLANLPAVWPPDAGHGEAPAVLPEPSPETATDGTEPGRHLRDYPWPLLIIAAPAAVAIWSGWVGLGEMCGFGPIHPLPGITDSFTINTAITLPIGVEAYGAYALAVWLGAKKISARTRGWARASAIGALALGCLGQIAFHLLSAARWTQAPWPVVTIVSCLPVVSLALAAALAHMVIADLRGDTEVAIEPDAEVDIPALVPVDIEPPVEMDIEAPAPVDIGPDMTAPKPKPAEVDKPKPATRTSKRTPTAAEKVAAVLRRDPNLSNIEVAKRAGVSAKTVQRTRPRPE